MGGVESTRRPSTALPPLHRHPRGASSPAAPPAGTPLAARRWEGAAAWAAPAPPPGCCSRGGWVGGGCGWVVGWGAPRKWKLWPPLPSTLLPSTDHPQTHKQRSERKKARAVHPTCGPVHSSGSVRRRRHPPPPAAARRRRLLRPAQRCAPPPAPPPHSGPADSSVCEVGGVGLARGVGIQLRTDALPGGAVKDHATPWTNRPKQPPPPAKTIDMWTQSTTLHPPWRARRRWLRQPRLRPQPTA